MIHITSLEEIESVLLRADETVDYFERRDPRFMDMTKSWLVEIEKALTNSRLPVAAEVAGLRALLISAERGSVPEWLQITGARTARKVKSAITAEVLRRAAVAVNDSLKGSVSTVLEAEKLARQLLAAGRRKSIVPAETAGLPHEAWLKAVYKSISDDPELGAGTAHLTGLVGFYDALILLDRASSAVSESG